MDEQHSITFAFLRTMIGNMHMRALGRVGRLKQGVAGFQYWGGDGLPTLTPMTPTFRHFHTHATPTSCPTTSDLCAVSLVDFRRPYFLSST